MLIVLLLQLWTQPSVRILGLGTDFAGYIPDPMTDVLRNPAYLKGFGYSYDGSHSSLQIYTVMQKYRGRGLTL